MLHNFVDSLETNGHMNIAKAIIAFIGFTIVFGLLAIFLYYDDKKDQ